MSRWVLSLCVVAALTGSCAESPTEPSTVEVVFTLAPTFPTASGNMVVNISTVTGVHPPAPIEPVDQVLLPFSHVTGAYQDLRLRVPARARDGETLVVHAFICLGDGRAWTTGFRGTLAELRQAAESRVSFQLGRLEGTCAPPTT